MQRNVHPQRSAILRRLALALAVFVFVAGCGDDDVTTSADDPANDDPSNGDTSDGDASDGDTAAGDDDDGPAPSGSCDVVSADEVAAAAGIEVAETTEASGTGTLQDVAYATVGCHYEAAGGGHLSVMVLVDDAGTQLDAAVFDELLTTSEGLRADTFPHEEVTGLGERAFFAAGLGPSDTLFVDAGPAGILQIENHRRLPLDRDVLRTVGAAAVAAYA